MSVVKTVEDLFYDVAFMAFDDGIIALYVSDMKTANALCEYCGRNSIKTDWNIDENESRIQINYTYKIKYEECIDSYISKTNTIKKLIRYEGKNESCGTDIINAEKIFRK